ncbi:MAG: PPC domain-containing protein [Nitrososphaerota archaeon]
MRILILTILALTLLTPPIILGQKVGEPGTNFSTALQLTPGEYVFRLDTGDLHYFSVDLERGETLLVVLRMPSNQDFDIYLLSPLREIIDQGVRTAGLTERIGYQAVEDGPHYLVVLGFGGSSGTYTLSISTARPPTKTETVTATFTTKLLEVETRLSVVTQTLTIERVVTSTVTVARDVERLPWTMVGLALLSLSIVYAGLSLGGALGSVGRAARGGGEASQPTAAEKPMERAETSPQKETLGGESSG